MFPFNFSFFFLMFFKLYFFLGYSAIWKDFPFEVKAEYSSCFSVNTFSLWMLEDVLMQSPLRIKPLWPGKMYKCFCWFTGSCLSGVPECHPRCCTVDSMWQQRHLADVSSGCLWWGAVISGTSSHVCNVYSASVSHWQNSYRQWVERGLTFCLREQTWKQPSQAMFGSVQFL